MRESASFEVYLKDMNNQNFKIDIKYLWALLIGSMVLTIIGAVAKTQSREYSQFVLASGLILYISTLIIIISDMSKNKIRNKTFWIVSMFIIPAIASIVYLLQRKNLINRSD